MMSPCDSCTKIGIVSPCIGCPFNDRKSADEIEKITGCRLPSGAEIAKRLKEEKQNK